jgi:hypothetical protein
MAKATSSRGRSRTPQVPLITRQSPRITTISNREHVELEHAPTH